MTIGQLIDRLKKFNPDTEVMIIDGFNSVGVPRDINVGPKSRTIDEEDAEQAGDCEGRVGQKVVVVGFGCY